MSRAEEGEDEGEPAGEMLHEGLELFVSLGGVGAGEGPGCGLRWRAGQERLVVSLLESGGLLSHRSQRSDHILEAPHRLGVWSQPA